jgi:hypothetical protein
MELNEQTLEQILTRQEEKFERALTREREQYQHYMAIQVEALRSDIKLVAEIVSGIQEQLIALRDMVAKNTEDIELIKIDIEVMKAELAIIRRDLKEKVGRDELAVLYIKPFSYTVSPPPGTEHASQLA